MKGTGLVQNQCHRLVTRSWRKKYPACQSPYRLPYYYYNVILT